MDGVLSLRRVNRPKLKLTWIALVWGTAGWVFFTRKTEFVPFDTSAPDFRASPIMKRLNPTLNDPVCIDQAVRRVPLKKLRTNDPEELTKGFARGLWGGPGFGIQRRILERWHRHKDGRSDQLWDAVQLKSSEYSAGTRLADHFEVVERTPHKVVMRCGDSPTIQERRASDGLFIQEVEIDRDVAVFRMKSIFFNGMDNAPPGKLPWWFKPAHKLYVKLWMETSVRQLTR